MATNELYIVILVAGRGTRLGGDTPKPLVPIGGGRTLLGNQIEVLGRFVDRDRMMLVVGHAADQIIKAHPDLMYVYNADYATTNTSKSLLGALRKVDGDVMWLNGDLYFEPPAARLLIESYPDDSRILVNNAAVGDEEVKYSLRADGSVDEISKQVTRPRGESVGMHVLKGKDRPALIDALQRVADNDYFEGGLEKCTRSQQIRLMPVDLGGNFCCEVDFPEDLQAVRDHLKNTGVP